MERAGDQGEDEKTLPPPALYVHVPWCLSKCPYCDFNSRPLRGGNIPERAYVERLLRDLEQEAAALFPPRPLISLFIGGGTPSLLSGEAIAALLRGVRDLMVLPADAEITLEANPGSADAARFAAYREAGVNRLSIGAQSLSARHLARISRPHGPRDVVSAVALARRAGFENLNLDLMYGLPGQSPAQARRDLEEALALEPEHLSYYQLSLEPGTPFYQAPPPLPDQDLVADMQLQGAALSEARGFRRYEVSAYAAAQYRCRHNLNYWRFGDYIGIGAGAHGKLTFASPRRRIERHWKLSDPAAYLNPANRNRLIAGERALSEADLVSEFALNALRLTDGFDASLFQRHTGLPFARIAAAIAKARSAGLLAPPEQGRQRVRPTELGYRFLDNLLEYFTE